MKETKSGDRWTYQYEYIRCGKKNCRACPHGPYCYGYQHTAAGMKKKYLGRNPDFGADREEDTAAQEGERKRRDPRNDIFCKATATVKLAAEILGISPIADVSVARKAFREATMKYHPDRGGDEHEFKLHQTAWSYLRAFHGWK